MLADRVEEGIFGSFFESEAKGIQGCWEGYSRGIRHHLGVFGFSGHLKVLVFYSQERAEKVTELAFYNIRRGNGGKQCIFLCSALSVRWLGSFLNTLRRNPRISPFLSNLVFRILPPSLSLTPSLHNFRTLPPSLSL